MRTFTVSAAAVLVLSVSACGSSGGSGAAATPGDSNTPTSVTVSVVPSIDSASLYLADQQGFFKDEGLAVTFAQAGSGPAAVASVVSNSAQFGLAANVALVQARSKNVPLVAVAPAAGTGDDPAKSKDQVVVSAKSGINSFAGLAGRTVAVVALKNSPELFIRDLIDQNGGDSSTTKFVAVPFPEMGTALRAGRVDAIAVSEPFLAGAVAAGGKAIGSYIDGAIGSKSAYTWWFTSQQFAKRSPKVAAAFQRAMAKAGSYANQHPADVRSIVTEKLKIAAAVASKINLPDFASKPDPAIFDKVMGLMVKYHFISKPISLDGVVFTD